MSWGLTDLVHPVHSNGQQKVSHPIHYPITPIFNAICTNGIEASTIGFSLGGFFQQNEFTNNYYTAEPPEERGYNAICGNSRYSVATIDGHYTYPNQGVQENELLTETLTLSIVFNTTPGAEYVTMQQDEAGNSTDGWYPWPVHSQTTTSQVAGNPNNNPAEDYNPYLWKEITLSNKVTRAYIEQKLLDWQGQTQAFRFATGANYGIAHATESIDGNASVGGGHFRIKNLNPFSDTLPTAADSEKDFWGVNYFAHILVSQRLLSPTIYSERYKTEESVGGFKGPVADRMSIYNAGFSEEALLGIITTNIWKDQYGVFNDGGGLLAAAPKISLPYLSSSGLPYYTGPGKGHEVVFVSRNGLPTRITIEQGVNTVRITTDPATLRVAYAFPATANTGWVALVEQLVSGQWMAIGGEEVIGNDASIPTVQVLHYVRKRAGEKWGFKEWKAPYEARYLTKTFTKDLKVDTALPEDEAGGTACGSVITGSFLLHTTQSHSETTGALLPQQTTDFEMTVDSTNWTVAAQNQFAWHVSGTTTINNATKLRKEMVVNPRKGRFFVRFDDPRAPDGASNAANSHGKVISSEWIKVPVTVDSNYHQVDWRKIPTAAAGQCVTIDGFRLSEA